MKYEKGGRKNLRMWLEVIEPFSNIIINMKFVLKNNTVSSQSINLT